MTAAEVVSVCGARVRRCRECQNTLGVREDVCAKCGSNDVDDDSSCRRRPLAGGNRCAKHGGKSPRAVGRVAADEIEAHARAQLVRLGRPDAIGHPVEELLDLAAEFKARNRFFRDRLAELDSLAAVDSFGVERARAIVVASREAATDLQRSLEGLVKLDLESRRVRLAEDQARQVWDAVDAGLRRALPESDEYGRVRRSIGDAAQTMLGELDPGSVAAKLAEQESDRLFDGVVKAIENALKLLPPGIGGRFRSAFADSLRALDAGRPVPVVVPEVGWRWVAESEYQELSARPVVTAAWGVEGLEASGTAVDPSEPVSGAVGGVEVSDPVVVAPLGDRLEAISEPSVPSECATGSSGPGGIASASVGRPVLADDSGGIDLAHPNRGPKAPEGSWLK